MSSARPQSEISLDTLDFWPASVRRKLAEAWITQARQVIAIASTPDGLAGLARQAEVPPEEMRKLLELTKQHVPEETVRRMETKVDASRFGLGAVKPPDLE
jgi:methylphosphotriester-DNA--protein-cysteine methyltransferase